MNVKLQEFLVKEWFKKLPCPHFGIQGSHIVFIRGYLDDKQIKRAICQYCNCTWDEDEAREIYRISHDFPVDGKLELANQSMRNILALAKELRG